MKSFKEEIKEYAEKIRLMKREHGYDWCRLDSYLMRLKYIAYKHYINDLYEFDFNFFKNSGIERYPERILLKDIKRINKYLESWKED